MSAPFTIGVKTFTIGVKSFPTPTTQPSGVPYLLGKWGTLEL